MKKDVRTSVAWCLTACMVFMVFTGFVVQKGFGAIQYEESYQIFHDTYYQRLIGENPQRGIVDAHVVVCDLSTSGLRPFVFAGEVRGTYTVDSMVKAAESNGYKVVAAINGDIFDTGTGTPRGTVIHNGNIITSGYHSDRVIAFYKDGTLGMSQVQLEYKYLSLGTQGLKGEITYFNVPDGGAGGLFLYNRNYSSSTGTAGERIEVVVEVPDMQMGVNRVLKGTVKKIVEGANTIIGNQELVLSTSKTSSYYENLVRLTVGEEIEISCMEQGTGLADAVEAVGIYHSIVENGKMVTNGTAVNPRTALGLKRDGSLVFYVMDGRQGALSNGLTIEELAYHMIELGCVSAWNLDGGGSSQMLMRKPGIDERASLKNSPSGGSPRAVSNGLLLVYEDVGNKVVSRIHTYPANTLLLPGESVVLKTYATNAYYEKVSAPTGAYYVTDRYGTMEGDRFVAGAGAGNATIQASVEGLKSQALVQIVDQVNILPGSSKWTLKPGESKQVEANIAYGKVPMPNSKPSFAYACDANIGTIDGNGMFRAANLRSEVTGKITISYGSQKADIAVTVTPVTLSPVLFSDTYGHWAKEYIGILAAMGKVSGVGNDMYMPDGALTRAQFVAFLAKATDGIDVTQAQAANFKDVSSSEWSYAYINWAYQEGIVSGVGDFLFNPDSSITREQMAVMLCNYAVYQGFALPQQEGVFTDFVDKNRISPWARDYVQTVVGSKMMSGMGEKRFAPQGVATRAQAAKIIYEYIDAREGIND
jgi:hypothetical protein